MFRGREQAHPERGRALLERLFEDIGELAVIEQDPQQEGRNMHMMLAPPAGSARPRDEAGDGAAAAPDGAEARRSRRTRGGSGDEPAAAA